MGLLKRIAEAYKKHREGKEEAKRVAAEDATLGVTAPTTESEAIRVAKEQKKQTTSIMRGDAQYHKLSESELSALNLTDTLQVNGTSVMPVVEVTPQGSYKIAEERIAKDSELTVSDIVFMYQSTREKYAFRDIVQVSLTEKYKPLFAKRKADSKKTLYQELEDEQKELEEARDKKIQEINERRKKALEELDAKTGETRQQQTAPFEAARQNEQAIQGFYRTLQDACNLVAVTQQDRASMKFLKTNFVNDALDELGVAEGHGEYLSKYSSSVNVPVSVLAIYDLTQQGAIPSIEEISVIQKRIRGEGKKAGKTYRLDSDQVKSLYAKRSQIEPLTMRSFFDEMVGFTVDENKGVIVPLTDSEGKPRPGKFEEFAPAIAIVSKKVKAEVELSTMIGIDDSIKKAGQSQRKVERQVDSEYEAEKKKINADFDKEVSDAQEEYSSSLAEKRTEYAELVEQSEYFDQTGLDDLVAGVMKSFEEQYGDKVDSVIDKTHAKDTVKAVELAFGLLQKAVNSSLQGYYSGKYEELMNSYKLPDDIINLTDEEIEELSKDSFRKIIGYQESKTPFIKKYAKDFATITSYNERIYALQDRVVRYELTNPTKAEEAKQEIAGLRKKSAVVLKSIEAREEVEQARNLLGQVRYNSIENNADLRTARVNVLERNRQKALKAADVAEREEEKKNKTNLSKIESVHKKNISDEEYLHKVKLEGIEADYKKKISEENVEYARLLKDTESSFDDQIAEETRRHNSELAKLTSINKAELLKTRIKLRETTKTLEEVQASQDEVVKEEYLKSASQILADVNNTFEFGGRAKSKSDVEKIIARLTKEARNLTSDQLRERILEEVETVTRENVPARDKRNRALIDQRVADSVEDASLVLDDAVKVAEKRNTTLRTQQQLLEKRIEETKQKIEELEQPTITNVEALEAENAEHERKLREIEEAKSAELRRLESEHDSVISVIKAETREAKEEEEERHTGVIELEQDSYDKSLELESERHEYALSDIEHSRESAQQTYDDGVEQADSDLLLAVRHVKSKTLSDGFGLLSAGIKRLQTRREECLALDPEMDVSEIDSTIESYQQQQQKFAEEAEKFGLTLTPDGTELTDEQYLERVRAERKAEEEAARQSEAAQETEVAQTVAEEETTEIEQVEVEEVVQTPDRTSTRVVNPGEGTVVEQNEEQVTSNTDTVVDEELVADSQVETSGQTQQTVTEETVDNPTETVVAQNGEQTPTNTDTVVEEHAQEHETADAEDNQNPVSEESAEQESTATPKELQDALDAVEKGDIDKVSKFAAGILGKELDKLISKYHGKSIDEKTKETLKQQITDTYYAAHPEQKPAEQVVEESVVTQETPVADTSASAEPTEAELQAATQAICGVLADEFASHKTLGYKRAQTYRILVSQGLSKEEISQCLTKNGTISIVKARKALAVKGVTLDDELEAVEGQLRSVETPDKAKTTYEESKKKLDERTKPGVDANGDIIVPEGAESVEMRNLVLMTYGQGIFDERTLDASARELVTKAKASGIDLKNPDALKQFAAGQTFEAKDGLNGQTLEGATTARVNEQKQMAQQAVSGMNGGAGAGGAGSDTPPTGGMGGR